MNKVILAGNLGADPEIKVTQNGKKLAQLRLATTERWKNKDGEVRNKTNWHTVVVFNPNLVTLMEKYARKGSKLLITGKLQNRDWEAQDGTKRRSTEIVLDFGGEIELLDRKADSGENTLNFNEPKPEAKPELEDEIPF